MLPGFDSSNIKEYKKNKKLAKDSHMNTRAFLTALLLILILAYPLPVRAAQEP